MSTALHPVPHAHLIPALAGGETWGAGDVAAADRLRPTTRRTTLAAGESIKRACDLVLTLVGLPLVLPVMLVVAIGIKLTDGGPILFRQTRVGRGGELFTILKFRTMIVDAEARLAALVPSNQSAAHLFKLRHDPRITRIGGVLRKLSLDELPQLFNVLGGSMSLVSPRPHLPAEVARMSVEAQRRAEAKPGITGLWQISGRSDLDEATSVALDLRYVETRSLGLDLRILAGTFAAVLVSRGAH